MTAIARQLKDHSNELQPPGWPRLVLKITGGFEVWMGLMGLPWASTTIKIMVDPIWMIKTLR